MNDPAMVDVVFNVRGSAIPHDHAYALYSAISRLVPDVHAATDVGIFPIRGHSAGTGLLRLGTGSILRLRLRPEKIPTLLTLSGKPLDVDGHQMQVGVPRVVPLIPASTVAAAIVTIKLAKPGVGGDFVAPAAFLDAARRQLQERGVQGEPSLLAHRAGSKQGQPLRRVVRIKGQTHVGYGMAVEALTADESIVLQEQGLGGRRLMGCGLFLPEQGGK